MEVVGYSAGQLNLCRVLAKRSAHLQFKLHGPYIANTPCPLHFFAQFPVLHL